MDFTQRSHDAYSRETPATSRGDKLGATAGLEFGSVTIEHSNRNER